MGIPEVALRRIVAGTLLLSGCSGEGADPSSTHVPAYVTVSAEIGGAIPGKGVQLTATAFDPLGQPLPGTTFEWTAADSFLATVDANGLVTAHHPGQVFILARADTAQGGIGFTVLEPVRSALLRGVRAAVVPGASFRPLAQGARANPQESVGSSQ